MFLGQKKSTAQDLASGLRWQTERERAAGSECQALAVPFQLPPQASSACELDPGKLKQEKVPVLFPKGALPSQGSHLLSEPEDWLPPFWVRKYSIAFFLGP